MTPEELYARTAGKTLLDLFAATSADSPDAIALRQRSEAGWRELSWQDLSALAARFAGSLRDRDVKRGDPVCLLLRNRMEHIIADLGCLLTGAVPTSIYLTSSPEQIRWLVADSAARVLIVDGPVELDRVEQVRGDLPLLEHLVTVTEVAGKDLNVERFSDWLTTSPVSWTDARASVTAEDVATVIYTSGTTGVPKAAEHTHANLVALAESVQVCFGGDFRHKRLISYMPMAHIADRGNSYYSAIRAAHTVTCCPDIADLDSLILDVRPQQLFGPPRMWEKMSDGLLSDPSLDISRPEDHLAMRARVGIDALEIAATGAATLPPHVAERLQAVGVVLTDMYGLTEFGSATGSPRQHRGQTVGLPLPGVELRIADDGEVQLRGPAAFRGYRGNPEATAAAFTDDGFVRTGDIGRVDADGYLRLVGRRKDIIVTLGGQNVAPAPLENAVVKHPLVAAAVVVGEARRYLSALVVLDPVKASEWSRAQGLQLASFAELATNAQVRAEVERHVESVNRQFARVEQLKKITILTEPWLPDSDEMTPTMKVRRAHVLEKYSSEIDAMYR